MEGFLLKELLLSYDENYVFEINIEGMIGVKKKKLQYGKTKGDYVYKFRLKDKKRC